MKSPFDLRLRAGLDFSGTAWHFPATFERGFASSGGRSQGRSMVQKAVGIVGHGSRRTERRIGAELASADGSSNLCRGPVMRVDLVRDVSANVTRGARVMPSAFEDVEDGRLRARAIFGRGLTSSGAACHLRARRAMGRAQAIVARTMDGCRTKTLTLAPALRTNRQRQVPCLAPLPIRTFWARGVRNHCRPGTGAPGWLRFRSP